MHEETFGEIATNCKMISKLQECPPCSMLYAIAIEMIHTRIQRKKIVCTCFRLLIPQLCGKFGPYVHRKHCLLSFLSPVSPICLPLMLRPCPIDLFLAFCRNPLSVSQVFNSTRSGFVERYVPLLNAVLGRTFAHLEHAPHWALKTSPCVSLEFLRSFLSSSRHMTNFTVTKRC